MHRSLADRHTSGRTARGASSDSSTALQDVVQSIQLGSGDSNSSAQQVADTQAFSPLPTVAAQRPPPNLIRRFGGPDSTRYRSNYMSDRDDSAGRDELNWRTLHRVRRIQQTTSHRLLSATTEAERAAIVDDALRAQREVEKLHRAASATSVSAAAAAVVGRPAAYVEPAPRRVAADTVPHSAPPLFSTVYSREATHRSAADAESPGRGVARQQSYSAPSWHRPPNSLAPNLHPHSHPHPLLRPDSHLREGSVATPANWLAARSQSASPATTHRRHSQLVGVTSGKDEEAQRYCPQLRSIDELNALSDIFVRFVATARRRSRLCDAASASAATVGGRTDCAELCRQSIARS